VLVGLIYLACLHYSFCDKVNSLLAKCTCTIVIQIAKWEKEKEQMKKKERIKTSTRSRNNKLHSKFGIFGYVLDKILSRSYIYVETDDPVLQSH
jgi:hypothetical protein